MYILKEDINQSYFIVFISEFDDKKKGSTLGRFFKNVGIRRSGRKFPYKQHEGMVIYKYIPCSIYELHSGVLQGGVVAGDLHASEITMSDDDRIDLMIKVKEGKLSMHDAVEIVSPLIPPPPMLLAFA